MNEIFIREVLSSLSSLGKKKLRLIEDVLHRQLDGKKVLYDTEAKEDLDNKTAIDTFLAAKRIEGCSEKTEKYYRSTLNLFFSKTEEQYQRINTNNIRVFLTNYQQSSGANKTTVDNIRRIISSFFAWLEAEDYIVKSPVRRIKKVKVGKKVKEVYSDETIEKLKAKAKNVRDLAIIAFLYSTGVRVGELVKLNVCDVDFERRECVVLGKGNKQRKVYFDAVSKLYLQEYLQNRKEGCEALFCSLQTPIRRLEISGVEIALRKIGKSAGIPNVHPHKFRRTLATRAIDKGMPIEQVQRMLGHSQIDTTLEYAMVDDGNVKLSHKKYLE